MRDEETEAQRRRVARQGAQLSEWALSIPFATHSTPGQGSDQRTAPTPCPRTSSARPAPPGLGGEKAGLRAGPGRVETAEGGPPRRAGSRRGAFPENVEVRRCCSPRTFASASPSCAWRPCRGLWSSSTMCCPPTPGWASR